MKIFPILVLGCALLGTEVVVAQVSSLPGVSTPVPTPTPTPTPTPVRAVKRQPVKVAPLPKAVKKPDLKGIQAEQAMRFQSLKGTDLKDRPKFDPKEDEGTGKPSLKEGQLLRLGVGGPRREANSDVTRVTPRGGQATTFDLSKSLAASDLQDLLMSDTVKEGAGRNIREDLGKAKGLGVDFGSRGSVVGGSVSDVNGKTLDRGVVGGKIGKFRKGMGLSRGVTDRVGNRQSRFTEGQLWEYTDPNSGLNWSILLVPNSKVDENGEYHQEGGIEGADAAIPVDDVLLEAFQDGSEEAFDELSMIIQNGINKHGTKRTSKYSAGEAGETQENQSAGEQVVMARSDTFGAQLDAEGEQEAGDDANEAVASSAGQAATAESKTNDSEDGGSADEEEGATMTFTEEETAGDGDSDDGTDDDDDDDDSGPSERGALGGEQENDKGGGPGNLNGKRFRGIVVGGFSGSGSGDTVRTGEMTGRGGPLAKDPKSGNSGHPTVRTDPDALREGMLNLGKIDDILAGKNGPIDFGEKGDPRGQPRPEGGEGTEGPTIVGGGSPGVVTRKSRAGTLTKLGDIKGEATRGVQTGRVDIKEVEIKEGSQLKAK